MVLYLALIRPHSLYGFVRVHLANAPPSDTDTLHLPLDRLLWWSSGRYGRYSIHGRIRFPGQAALAFPVQLYRCRMVLCVCRRNRGEAMRVLF